MNSKIFDIDSFQKFLQERIKVNGKTGSSAVTIARDMTKLTITTTVPMSKAYLKYLTKKFLRKQQLRDYIRVISSDKSTYQLRFFNIKNDDEEEEEAEKAE